MHAFQISATKSWCFKYRLLKLNFTCKNGKCRQKIHADTCIRILAQVFNLT